MSLARGGTILFAASMAGNISNYLFQFFMGKRLSLEDYGALNAVFSLLVIVAIPSTTIMLVIARYTAVFKAKGEVKKISTMYRNSVVKMAALGIVFFLPFFIFNRPISAYLNIDDTLPVTIIGLGVFFSFIVTVNFGLLQGLQRFYYLGAGMGMTGVGKLVFGVVLVVMGFGLNGAAASVVFSSLVVFALTTVPLSGYYRAKTPKGGGSTQTREIIAYSIPVLLSTVAVTTITNVDIIFVKHFFPPRYSGLYAAVAVLGKTILYLPAAFVLALFPMVSASNHVDSGTFRILDRGLLYTLGISLAGVLGFCLFPGWIIGSLFGERFIEAAPLLKYYALAMMSMAVMTVLISFNLARNKTSFIYTLLAGCVLLVLGLNFFHSTLLAVILTVMFTNLFITALHLWMTHRDRRSVAKLKNWRESDGDEFGFYNHTG